MELREIGTPTSNAYTITIPDEMIGKEIEFIASEVVNKDSDTQEEKAARLFESAAKLKVDLSNWKFDRDEANNYDE